MYEVAYSHRHGTAMNETVEVNIISLEQIIPYLNVLYLELERSSLMVENYLRLKLLVHMVHYRCYKI